jgi:hypothetical protein
MSQSPQRRQIGVIVVQVGQDHQVGWAFFQQVRCRIWPVALQEQEPIPQNGIGQNANMADVDQNGRVADVMNLSQQLSLSRCPAQAATHLVMNRAMLAVCQA